MFIAKLSSSWQLKPQLNWDSIITTCLPTPHPNLTGIVLISGAAGLKLCIYAYPRRICLFFSDVQTYGGVHPPPDMTTKNFSLNKVFAEKEFLPKKNLPKKICKKMWSKKMWSKKIWSRKNVSPKKKKLRNKKNSKKNL